MKRYIVWHDNYREQRGNTISYAKWARTKKKAFSIARGMLNSGIKTVYVQSLLYNKVWEIKKEG